MSDAGESWDEVKGALGEERKRLEEQKQMIMTALWKKMMGDTPGEAPGGAPASPAPAQAPAPAPTSTPTPTPSSAPAAPQDTLPPPPVPPPLNQDNAQMILSLLAQQAPPPPPQATPAPAPTPAPTPTATPTPAPQEQLLNLLLQAATPAPAPTPTPQEQLRNLLLQAQGGAAPPQVQANPNPLLALFANAGTATAMPPAKRQRLNDGSRNDAPPDAFAENKVFSSRDYVPPHEKEIHAYYKLQKDAFSPGCPAMRCRYRNEDIENSNTRSAAKLYAGPRHGSGGEGLAENYNFIPYGLHYEPDFLTQEEENMLAACVDADPTKWDTSMNRRTQQYGYKFQHKTLTLVPAEDPIPPYCMALCEKMKSQGIVKHLPNQLIINEYEPGQGINPHCDQHCFDDTVVVVSILSDCTMTWINHADQFAVDYGVDKKKSVLTRIEARSLYRFSDVARWKWHHCLKSIDGDVTADGRDGQRRLRRISFTFRYVDKVKWERRLAYLSSGVNSEEEELRRKTRPKKGEGKGKGGKDGKGRKDGKGGKDGKGDKGGKGGKRDSWGKYGNSNNNNFDNYANNNNFNNNNGQYNAFAGAPSTGFPMQGQGQGQPPQFPMGAMNNMGNMGNMGNNNMGNPPAPMVDPKAVLALLALQANANNNNNTNTNNANGSNGNSGWSH